MIDICTVVFRDEIPVLKLQAQSVGTYAQNCGVRNVYVVLNDEETFVNDIDPRWWMGLAANVLVVPRTAFSAEWVPDGWVSQQLWKMLTAAMSYNDFTMVLDAKTILTKPIDIKSLVDETGRLKVGRNPLYEVFHESQDIAEKLFGIEMTEQLGPGGVPFFFHNDTVRAMITDCNLRTHQSFPRWFQKQGKLTEFILYSAYCQFRYGTLDALYSRENAVLPANLCHSEVARADQILRAFATDSTTSVGIHRRAWSQLTKEQQQQYRMLLIDRGITAAWDL